VEHNLYSTQKNCATFIFVVSSVAVDRFRHFYRASACNACKARYSYGKSVRLSDHCLYCVKTNAHIVTFSDYV